MGAIASQNTAALTGTALRKILLVEDTPLLADVLGRMLTDEGFEVEIVDNPQEAPGIARGWCPGTALIDLSDPALTAATVAALSEAGPGVLVLTGDDTAAELADYLDVGADGFLGPDSSFSDLLRAISTLARGGQVLPLEQRYRIEDARRERAKLEAKLQPFRSLTQREAEVMLALVEGKSAAEIADDNCVALSTVRTQIRAILNKLNVRSQLAAVALARKTRWNQ